MTKKSFLSFVKLNALLLFVYCCSSNTVFSQAKTVGLTKHFAGGQENGYVLFAPIGSDTTYLINKCGKKVHTWYSPYTPGLSGYLLPNGHLLKTGTFNDTAFGPAGGRGGIIEEFDWDGNLKWRYKIFNDSLCQHHDITPMPNGNVLVLAWHAISKAEAVALGRDTLNFNGAQTDLWGERIIELTPVGPDSAVIAWQWDLFDHIIQNKDSTLPNYGIIGQNPQLLNINYALDLNTHDWIHANGLDYNKDLDQIVISCHNISEFWIIDHGTTISEAKSHTGGKYGKGGDLLYRWGNPAAYNKGVAKDRKLFRQHNAQWIRNGLKDSGSIMLFNNGWNRDTAYSTVDIIKTPVNAMGYYLSGLPYLPLNQSWIYKDSIPKNFYSQIISGAQRLANGNTLICSGVQGRFFEVTQQKKTVWEYKCPITKGSAQADGDLPANNSTFRCTFYPETYSAFNSRNLAPKGTIEKKPYAYSCNYETVPPKLMVLEPAKNTLAVSASPVLKITFDEAVLKKTGNIQIFQNNTLLETIPVTNSAVAVNNNVVTINQTKSFSVKSVISIKVPAGCFRDSSNNLSKLIDTSAWHFYTENRQINLVSLTPAHLTTNIPTNAQLKILYDDNIFKSSAGQVRIFENNNLKETILIGSSNIVVQGKEATITPSVNFAFNADILVDLDTCFKNSMESYNNVINLGAWSFKTVSLPKRTALIPANLSTNISVNTTLSVDFDRPIVYGLSGNLMVYENSVLKDSILINGPRASINGSSISFDVNSDFSKIAWISIGLKTDLLKDTFGTYFTGIDSSEWHFTTELKPINSITNTKVNDKGYKVYPNPNKGNFTITSLSKIETLEVFNSTGQKVESINSRLNDNSYEVRLKHIASGPYVIIINGNHFLNIIIE